MKQFDLKNWNDEVFLAYSRAIADPVKTNLIEAGVFNYDAELAQQFPAQTGGNYAIRPINGRLSGDAIDLDGNTDIDDGDLNTYSQGIVALHMGKSFTEKDFTFNLTGKDFMLQVAEQLANYWAKQEQKKMLSILKGIFASALAGSVIEKTAVTSTDIIDVVRKVGGDNANLFRVCFMHSTIAGILEKEEKLTYAKYNDANGLQRPSDIAYWNGRLVIVNDLCPVTVGTGEQEGKYIYRTYFLGARAFGYAPLPELVPVEMSREAKKNGGQTSLVSRDGLVLIPEGVSFKANVLQSTAKVSDAVLETGSNWEVVNDGNGHSVPAKNIPFCAIDYVL